MATTWQSILGDRSGTPFSVSVLKGADSLAPLAAPVSAFKPDVDKGKMCVTAVLTTRTPDRQGDIVDPVGGRFGDHVLNPLVMFHHGKDHKLPIGKAEDRDGNYTVRHVKARDGDVLIGTTHFSQSDRFANDVFGLIAEDMLRGVSIGFDPLSEDGAVERLGPSPVLDRPALHFKGWNLLEYSHTPLGVNPDAITLAVHKALDGSRKLHPALLKILQPLATPRRTTVAVTKGCSTAGFLNKPLVGSKLKRGKPIPKARVGKAMPMPGDEDDTQQPGDADNPDITDAGGDDDAALPGGLGQGDDFDPATDSPDSDPNLPEGYGAGDQDEEPPHTVQLLNDGAQGLLDLATALEGGAKKSEHIGGRKYCGALCTKLRQLAAQMSAKADSIHGELSGVPTDGGGAPDQSDEDEENASSESENPDDEAEATEPETDEDGALVKKGYQPRRWTYADLAGAVQPVVQPTASASELKALRSENAKLKTALNNLLEDVEAGQRRRSAS